jgi:cytidine deaminase
VSDGERAKLIEDARAAAHNAHAEHSKFRVGAAVQAGGQLFRGCNIENASIGLTMCAERVAIFSAVAAGFKKIDEIALSCVDAADTPTDGSDRMPCGGCLQVMAEFGGPDLPIHVDGVGTFPLRALLPHPFRLKAKKA